METTINLYHMNKQLPEARLWSRSYDALFFSDIIKNEAVNTDLYEHKATVVEPSISNKFCDIVIERHEISTTDAEGTRHQLCSWLYHNTNHIDDNWMLPIVAGHSQIELVDDNDIWELEHGIYPKIRSTSVDDVITITEDGITHIYVVDMYGHTKVATVSDNEFTFCEDRELNPIGR